MGIEHIDQDGKSTFTFPRGKDKPMDDPTIKTFNRHTITLLPNWQFQVAGPEFDDNKYAITFKSLQDAQEEIERRQGETSKIEAKKVTLHLIVLDENGERRVVERVNRTNAEVSGVPTRYFYPNVEWIREALARRKRLQSEAAQITTTLHKFQLEKSMGYGRIEADNYGPRVERLKTEFQDKTREALTTKLETVEDAAENNGPTAA